MPSIGTGLSFCCKEFTHYLTVHTFVDPKKEAVRKHCGKKRKCWCPAFSPFPTMFFSLPKTEIIIMIYI